MAAVHQRRLGEGEALAARAGSGRGCAEGTGADVRAGSSAAAQHAAAFLAGLMAPVEEAEGADSVEGGAARAQAHAEHKTGSNERSAPETQGGSNKRGDEKAGQRTVELQDGRQATAAGAKAEVVQSKAGEGRTRRTRTDPGTDGNGLSTPARGNGNDSDGKARAKTRRTPTRGKIQDR